MNEHLPQIRTEYRAVWTYDGDRCAGGIRPTAERALKDAEGWMYPKPDLSVEQRTVTIGPWAEVMA
jgi:hypothetical protein